MQAGWHSRTHRPWVSLPTAKSLPEVLRSYRPHYLLHLKAPKYTRAVSTLRASPSAPWHLELAQVTRLLPCPPRPHSALHRNPESFHSRSPAPSWSLLCTWSLEPLPFIAPYSLLALLPTCQHPSAPLLNFATAFSENTAPGKSC